MKNCTLFLFLLLACQLAAQPTSDGLVCWFPFNGNANDSSTFAHVGIVAGPELTTDRHGNPNSAYFFDGVDDYIQVTDHPELRLGSTSFTISVWINPASINDLQSHAVLSKRTGSGNQGYLFQLIGSDHIMGLGSGTFDIITSGGWDDPKLTTYAQLSPQNWHHVFYCYDSGTNTGQFFIDNVPDISGPMIDASSDAAADLYIGKDKLTDGIEYPSIAPGYFGGFHFYGAIDDIRIYNRKLSRPERDEIFGEGVSSTNAIAKDPKITIFPDPVSTFLNISTENTDIQSFKIHDTTGRLAIQAAYTPSIDCRQLPAGSFVISFLDKNGQIILSKKFIKS